MLAIRYDILNKQVKYNNDKATKLTELTQTEMSIILRRVVVIHLFLKSLKHKSLLLKIRGISIKLTLTQYR